MRRPGSRQAEGCHVPLRPRPGHRPELGKAVPDAVAVQGERDPAVDPVDDTIVDRVRDERPGRRDGPRRTGRRPGADGFRDGPKATILADADDLDPPLQDSGKVGDGPDDRPPPVGRGRPQVVEQGPERFPGRLAEVGRWSEQQGGRDRPSRRRGPGRRTRLRGRPRPVHPLVRSQGLGRRLQDRWLGGIAARSARRSGVEAVGSVRERPGQHDRELRASAGGRGDEGPDVIEDAALVGARRIGRSGQHRVDVAAQEEVRHGQRVDAAGAGPGRLPAGPPGDGQQPLQGAIRTGQDGHPRQRGGPGLQPRPGRQGSVGPELVGQVRIGCSEPVGQDPDDGIDRHRCGEGNTTEEPPAALEPGQQRGGRRDGPQVEGKAGPIVGSHGGDATASTA